MEILRASGDRIPLGGFFLYSSTEQRRCVTSSFIVSVNIPLRRVIQRERLVFVHWPGKGHAKAIVSPLRTGLSAFGAMGNGIGSRDIEMLKKNVLSSETWLSMKRRFFPGSLLLLLLAMR